MENPVQETILQQYIAYNFSKEKFIDRTFATNRFFMVTCLFILAACYIVSLLTPSLLILSALCALGIFTSILWWLNVASYSALIKVKYAKILEVLEQSLPKQPFKDEFYELSKMRQERFSFNYPDVQKLFAVLVFVTFTLVFAFNFFNWIKLFVLHNY